MALKDIFGRLFSKERRKADRQPFPQLAAYYWDGGAPKEHRIRDISSTGLFLITEERWYPGTLVVMTLQKSDAAEVSPTHSISVQSRAIRWESDGVGLEFILPDFGDSRRGQNILAEGTDRKTLEKFLQGFRADNGSAAVDRIARPGFLVDKSAR
jgi:hypothetical protein